MRKHKKNMIIRTFTGSPSAGCASEISSLRCPNAIFFSDIHYQKLTTDATIFFHQKLQNSFPKLTNITEKN